MKSKDLVNLMLSPQWTSKLLQHFISGAQTINPDGIKLELLFLVLPLLNDPVTRSAIKESNRSTFYSSFIKNDNFKGEDLLKLKNAITRKNNQTDEYRKYTNNGLIYLGNTSVLSINKRCKLDEVVLYQNEPLSIKAICKSAFYLGVIFAKEDHKNIFWKLGIINV